MSDALTINRLRELFLYDPSVGSFVRRISRGNQKSLSIAGSIDSSGYLQLMIDGRLYLAHRLAYFWVNGTWPPDQLDHVNKNRLDNRIANLRAATRGQNVANSEGRSASGFKGVYAHGRRWKAKIQQRHIGTYDTPGEAYAAWCRAAQEVHGEFACIAHKKDRRQILTATQRCTNAEPGTLNGECGKPAEWFGTNDRGHVQAFCSRCKEGGWEAAGRTMRPIKEN